MKTEELSESRGGEMEVGKRRKGQGDANRKSQRTWGKQTQKSETNKRYKKARSAKRKERR